MISLGMFEAGLGLGARVEVGNVSVVCDVPKDAVNKASGVVSTK